VLSYVDSFSRSVEDAGGGRMRYADAPADRRAQRRRRRLPAPAGPFDPVPPLVRPYPVPPRCDAGAAGSRLPRPARAPRVGAPARDDPGARRALRDGQSGQEDLNLAALLAWIDPPDGNDRCRGGRARGDPLLYPPAGPSTDPTFDNEILAPLIGTTASQPVLAGALRGQLAPIWRLLWQALGLLRQLPEGASVEARWTVDKTRSARTTSPR